MAAAVGAMRDGRGHRLLAGCAGSQLVHGYSGHGRGPAPGNRDRVFAGASVVAILALRFPFLYLHRQTDRPRECKRTGVATAARSTRSLISDLSDLRMRNAKCGMRIQFASFLFRIPQSAFVPVSVPRGTIPGGMGRGVEVDIED